MMHDSPEWRALRDEKIRGWLLGDLDAMRCIQTIISVAEIWDDIIDGEHKYTDDEIHRAFVDVLVNLPYNAWYRRHQHVLIPNIIMVINAWMDSLALERGDAHDKALAMYLKNMGLELYHLAALLIGGDDHARKVGPEMRRFFWHEHYKDVECLVG